MKKIIFRKLPFSGGFSFHSNYIPTMERFRGIEGIDPHRDLVAGVNKWKGYTRISSYVAEIIRRYGVCEAKIIAEIDKEYVVCKFDDGKMALMFIGDIKKFGNCLSIVDDFFDENLFRI